MQKTRARLLDCVPKGKKQALIPQEAAAAISASHPHIVTTYKYAIKHHERDAEEEGGTGENKEDVEVQDDEKPLQAGSVECWLCMEMCNKGTLQVTQLTIPTTYPPPHPYFCSVPCPLCAPHEPPHQNTTSAPPPPWPHPHPCFAPCPVCAPQEFSPQTPTSPSPLLAPIWSTTPYPVLHFAFTHGTHPRPHSTPTCRPAHHWSVT